MFKCRTAKKQRKWKQPFHVLNALRCSLLTYGLLTIMERVKGMLSWAKALALSSYIDKAMQDGCIAT